MEGETETLGGKPYMKKFLLHGLAALMASFIVSVGVAEPPRDEYSIAVKLPPMPEKDESPVVTR